MTLGSVSSAGTSQASTTSNATAIKELEKKIAEIQKEITKIQSDDSLDEETKSKQVSVYQTQVQSLQAQVSRLQREKSEQTDDTAQIQQDQQADGKNKAHGFMDVGQFLDQNT